MIAKPRGFGAVKNQILKLFGYKPSKSDQKIQMSVQIRIFLGFIQNKEIKMHLNQNQVWKEAKLLGQLPLTETQELDKEYIGSFIPAFISYQEIKKKEDEIKSQLKVYCPKLNLDNHRAYLLSQLFIS